MRKLLLAVAFAATLASVGSAEAQNWPTRQLTMVFPYAAGGSGDLLGRIFASRLSELLGQPVIFEIVVTEMKPLERSPSGELNDRVMASAVSQKS